jgi:hypothetical protein
MAAGLAVLACSSTALSPGDPNQLELTFEPAALIDVAEGGEGEVLAVAVNVDQPEDATGDPRTWSVQSSSFGAGLELRSWEFRSNFQLVLRVGVFAGVESGAHTLNLEISNHFGTFVATGELFVFPSR